MVQMKRFSSVLHSQTTDKKSEKTPFTNQKQTSIELIGVPIEHRIVEVAFFRYNFIYSDWIIRKYHKLHNCIWFTCVILE